MPSVNDETPDTLRPYLFHGIDLNWRKGDKEATGECPWCGGENKFSVDIKTSKWRCNKCVEGSTGGNSATFIKKLWEEGLNYDGGNFDNKILAANRKLLFDKTIETWQLVLSPITHNWLVPGFGGDCSFKTLYQYQNVGQRMALMPTPTFKHHLLGANLYRPKKPTVYLCEGLWDAMAWWETLSITKNVDGVFKQTGNPEASMLHESNVLATPSANVWQDSWCPLFAEKIVVLMCQNDHDQINPKTEKLVPGASWAGMQRIAVALQQAKKPPAEISVWCWDGSGEIGYNKELPHGYDIRDALVNA